MRDIHQGLWEAAERGSLEDVKQLVNDGAEVNFLHQGITPIQAALNKIYSEENPSPLTPKFSDWNGGLSRSHLNVAEFLVGCSGVDVACLTVPSKDGSKPLLLEAIDRHLINERHKKLESPSYYKIFDCEFLLDKGANPNVEFMGVTPLDQATRREFASVVTKLVEKGALVDQPVASFASHRAEKDTTVLELISDPSYREKNPHTYAEIRRALESGHTQKKARTS